MNNIRLQKGAAALIASIVVAIGILSIVLSTTIIALNNKSNLESFSDSIKSFYAAEAGVGETLMQLRKDPNNLIFDNVIINGITINRQFIEISCGTPPCDSMIEATASTTKATRKVRYTCDNDISNCFWSELIP